MKAYKFKLKPSKSFVAQCERTLNLCRELYNAALQERRDAWQINHVSINFHLQCLQLPEIKQIREEFDQAYSQVLQDVLRRISKTFDAFFRRCKAGEKPGYPRFKSASRYNSFTYPQSGFRLEGNKLYLSKIGSCRLRLSREIEGRIKTCTIRREADGWYVIFAVEENQSRYVPKTGNSVGIDVGIESFATLSTGEQIDNPRCYRTAEKRLQGAQRSVSGKINLRSKRRKKAVKLLAKKHLKVKRQREDFHHKVGLNLIRRYDDLAVEDLNIKGMVKNPSLAKSISDAAWGKFIAILECKAENAGRRVVKVPAQYTSQICSGCGERVRKRLSDRQHVCKCGVNLHRDHNAAINIKGRAYPSEVEQAIELRPRIPHYNAISV